MADRPSSLNVSLTRELADYVGDQVRSSRCRSASEVVRTALRLLQCQEPGFTGTDPTGARRATGAHDGHG